MNGDLQEKRKPLQRKFSDKVENGRVFAVCIDGSDHAEGAFNIVRNNFITQDDFLLAVYIFNSKKDKDFNYRNKKETIINNYGDKGCLLGPNRFILKTEDRSSNIHPLEQVNTIAAEHKAAYLFCGFFGLKGPRGDNNELTKGVDYMLKSASEPFVIIKDITERQNKQNLQFNWLFILDSFYPKADLILDKFLPLVDIERDHVHALVLSPRWNPNEELADVFNKKVAEHQIKNNSYEISSYEKKYSGHVNNMVNFGEMNYDFVVLFNSTQLYKLELNDSDNAQIILRASANICVYNQ